MRVRVPAQAKTYCVSVDRFDGGLKINRNLVLYTEGANMTPELEYIYENGKMAGKINGK